jgi:excisionase family DNA binding protein
MTVWMTRREAAAYLKISVRTLDAWRRAGRVRPHKVEGLRTVRYSQQDLDAALTRGTK